MHLTKISSQLKAKSFIVPVLTVVLIVVVVAMLFLKKQTKNRIGYVSALTGLSIPVNATFVGYSIERPDADNTYPYAFFAKFKIDESSYKEMVEKKLISSADSNNIIYKRSVGSTLGEKSFFWSFESKSIFSKPNWWNIPDVLDFDFLYANIFNDREKDKLGNVNKYNGRIASYYSKPYCFLYFECWPTSLTGNGTH